MGVGWEVRPFPGAKCTRFLAVSGLVVRAFALVCARGLRLATGILFIFVTGFAAFPFALLSAGLRFSFALLSFALLSAPALYAHMDLGGEPSRDAAGTRPSHVHPGPTRGPW